MTKLQELSEIKLIQCSQKGFSYSVLCLLTVKAARRGTTQWHRYKMVSDPKSLPLVLLCAVTVWGKSLSSYVQFRLIEFSYLKWQPSCIQQLYSKLYILSIVQKEKHTWWGKKNNLGLKVTEIMYSLCSNNKIPLREVKTYKTNFCEYPNLKCGCCSVARLCSPLSQPHGL